MGMDLVVFHESQGGVLVLSALARVEGLECVVLSMIPPLALTEGDETVPLDHQVVLALRIGEVENGNPTTL